MLCECVEPLQVCVCVCVTYRNRVSINCFANPQRKPERVWVRAYMRAYMIPLPPEVGGDFLMLFIVICVCLCDFSGHSTIQVMLVFKCVRARTCVRALS